MTKQRFIYSTLKSPIGEIIVTADEQGIRSIYSPTHESLIAQLENVKRDDAKLRDATDQLRAYFTGELQEFSLTLNPQGTPFFKQVWKQLVAIPYGTTISYGAIAKQIGKPSASRAVGMANGKNPISFVIPCHRVIGQNGSLTGYGGGLTLKRWLIDFEKSHLASNKASKSKSRCSLAAI